MSLSVFISWIASRTIVGLPKRNLAGAPRFPRVHPSGQIVVELYLEVRLNLSR